MATQEAPEPEQDRDLRITFQESGRDETDASGTGRGRRGRGDQSRARSRSRASSRRSSRSRPPPPTRYGGVQIEYRTLSIHVSESRHQEPDSSDDLKSPSKKDNTDYFANITYHELDKDAVCQQLNVSAKEGLSSNAVAIRLERDGKNTLPQPKTNYFKKIISYIFGGFCSVLWVGVIVFFICWRPLSNPPSPTNLALAILVLIVILLQAVFNAFSDWSTSRTMKSIVDLLPSETQVMRDGEMVSVPATELVAGDIVRLTMGNKVPADLRLLEHSGDIRFDRSMLTGESEEIEGAIDVTDPNFLETRNIALMGTMVVNGSGVGIVVLTGHRSVMGRIAQAMGDVKEVPTLIQLEITRFVKIIVCLTVVLALLIVFTWVGWLRKAHPGFLDVVAMLNNVMGCVVAFIPEGMPIGVSLTLMMVARRMKAVNILPKGLSTVETLGCVNVICSDKTGTLTQNLMTVASAAFADKPSSPQQVHESIASAEPSKAIQKLHAASVLCNDATFDPTSIHLPVQDRTVKGNATDAAVLRFASQNDAADKLKAEYKRAHTIPFNSKNKWMLTMYLLEPSEKPTYQVYMKGAPDVLFPSCTHYWSARDDCVLPIDAAARSALKATQDALSNNAERVIMLCEKTVTPNNYPGVNAFSDEISKTALEGLTVIGILGIIDPPRPEAVFTVAEVRRAGARFMMVTGDYGLTATAIARNIGIFTREARPDTIDSMRTNPDLSVGSLKQDRQNGGGRALLVEGSEVLGLIDEDWDLVCEYEEVVFARTTPEQKLRIVNE